MPNNTPEYHSAYYQLNKERLKQKSAKNFLANRERAYQHSKERRARVKDFLDNIKRNTPCMDCNKFYPPYIMDFDHVFGEKITNIAKVARIWGIPRLQAEIEKCELVCSNCHRERTFKTRKSPETVVIFKPSVIVPDVDLQ